MLASGCGVLLSEENSATSNLYRCLRQRPRCGAGLDLGAVGGIEDRTMARADQLPHVLAVGDRALLVRADRRVRDELALLRVHQNPRLPCLGVGEGEG